MRAAIAAAILSCMLPASTAHATGGLWCDSQDGPVKISIQSGMTRGMGFPVFDFRASAEVEDQSIAPDMRKLTFEGRHLPQYWFQDEELNMALYWERDGETFGSVEIIVRTKADDGDYGYGGTYTYKVLDGGGTNGGNVELSGKISCGVD